MIPIEHVHPMLVHSPIVLAIGLLALDLLIVVRGQSLVARTPLPMENHEGLGWTTAFVFLGLATLRLLAWRRGFDLAGARGWALASSSLAGVALVIVTAYHGGELVFQHGVNVAALR